MDRWSYMLAIPEEEWELQDSECLIERLNEISGLHLFKTEMEEESAVINMEMLYDDMLYTARIYPTEFDLPEYYRAQHLFPDVDVEALQMRRTGLIFEMAFAKDALVSYHLQLKILDAMFTGLLAVFDISAEKILSGRWVKLAAESDVPPAPKYLYTIQAVSDDDEEVWLHSHGLNRCGVTELEILGSDKENCESHYNILSTMAVRLLEAEKPLKPREPVFLAQLTEEVCLVATMIPWREAVAFYDEDVLGSAGDRDEEHNADTSCIFVYADSEDYEKGCISLVSIYDELLADNPVYMISNKETDRMKALALERLPFLRRVLGAENTLILVKIGLPVDNPEEAVAEKEHIWFELKDMDERMLRAELIQEPYYISGLHEGDIKEYTVDMITDWIIFMMPEQRITPDDVYLLEMIKE